MASGQLTCDEVRERLAAAHEGWLSPEDEQLLVRHVQSCAACAAEARHDERLVGLLASLAPQPVTAPAWEDVMQHHHNRHRRWVTAPALAMASAAVILAVAFLRHPVEAPRPVASPRVAVQQAASPESDLQTAHMLVSGGGAADPNRAVLLLAAQRSPDRWR